MTILPELRAHVAEANPAADDADIIWHHPAFCAFALPAAPDGAAAWQRELDGTSVIIEPGGERLPGGALLRRLLMHLCDTALRSGQAQVMLGPNAATLAAAMNPPVTGAAVAALEGQVAAVLSSRIVIATEDGPGLSMFDARGRPRAVAPDWRPAIRLNARFLDNLARDKVALDRAAVLAMQDSTLALDIYTWLAAAMPAQVGQTVLAESWPELRARFGAQGQDAEAFQTAFTAELAVLRAALPGLDADDDAIGVGFSARAEAPPATAPALAPAPAPAPPLPPEPEAPRRLSLRSFAPPPEAPPVEPPRADPPPPEPVRPVPPRPVPVRFEPVRPPEPRDPSQPMRQTISLKSHITGLQQVIWLQRAQGRDNVQIEVTPGSRYDPAVVTVLALEPIVLQIAGGLHARDFEKVSSWATANRDLIDLFWDGEIDGFEDIMSRVRRVPAPGADRYR